MLFTDVGRVYDAFRRPRPRSARRSCNAYFDGLCAPRSLSRVASSTHSWATLCSPSPTAPLEQPDHADRAVAAALAIDVFRRHTSAPSSRVRAGSDSVTSTRIGIHSGVAIVGNVGVPRTVAILRSGRHAEHGAAPGRAQQGNRHPDLRFRGDRYQMRQLHQFHPIGALCRQGRHGPDWTCSRRSTYGRYPPAWLGRYDAGVSNARGAGLQGEGRTLLHYTATIRKTLASRFHYGDSLAETGTVIEMPEK